MSAKLEAARMQLPMSTINQVWTRPSSVASKTIQKLENILDLRVVCNPNWECIIKGLDHLYESRSEVVCGVIHWVLAYFEAFLVLLGREQPVSALLGTLHDLAIDGKLHVELRVRASLGRDDVTSRRDFNTLIFRHGGLLVVIPDFDEVKSIYDELDPLDPEAFEKDILEALKDHHDPEATPDAIDTVMEEASEDTSMHMVSLDQTGRASARVSKMPVPSEVSAMALKCLPYRILIKEIDDGQVFVECSHPPSLKFITSSLMKLAREEKSRTDQTKPKFRYQAFSCRAMESAFNDTDSTMVFEKNRGAKTSLIGSMEILQVIFSMVEDMLGYRSVDTGGCFWRYRRDEPFEGETEAHSVP
ncbi:hypothetical protein HIM_06321 [Hirsutella minnesotensis 3608]|uniref:Uncharacterized protein n=1 Tax=Hirsutella minnesotensis 3608 TaxID=1043627 RepID=A0A0F7ZNT6_9HYPO|nr:hypothetical protein HIM_06321 [Hirsutella minnesotensis 3608]